jgi:hypothetical protein
MNQKQLQERVNNAADAVIEALTDVGIPQVPARKFAEKFTLHFIEKASWTIESMKELKDLEGEYIGTGMDIWSVVANVCKPLCFSYAERVRYFLNEFPEELTEEDAEKLKEDLEALEEFEVMCTDGCPVTDEHRELLNVLAQGIEPPTFPGVRGVTPTEVEQFKELGKKFGLSDDEIKLRIQATDYSTYKSRIDRILEVQKIVDARKEKNLKALDRTQHHEMNVNRFYRE